MAGKRRVPAKFGNRLKLSRKRSHREAFGSNYDDSKKSQKLIYGEPFQIIYLPASVRELMSTVLGKRSNGRAFPEGCEESASKRQKTKLEASDHCPLLLLPYEIKEMIFSYILRGKATKCPLMAPFTFAQAEELRRIEKKHHKYEELCKRKGSRGTRKVPSKTEKQRPMVLVSTTIFATCKQLHREVNQYIADKVPVLVTLSRTMTSRERQLLKTIRNPVVATSLFAHDLGQSGAIEILQRRKNLMNFYFILGTENVVGHMVLEGRVGERMSRTQLSFLQKLCDMLGTIKVTVDAGIGWIHWEKRAEEDNSKFRRKYDDMIEETTLLMMGL